MRAPAYAQYVVAIGVAPPLWPRPEDSGNERQQWNARSPLDGSTPPVSKIVGIRRGQSAAEELAVPDSYFAGPTGPTGPTVQHL